MTSETNRAAARCGLRGAATEGGAAAASHSTPTPRSGRRGPAVTFALLVAATALTGLFSTCSRSSGVADGPIILISIDTLRSDRLPAYGYRGVETPNIDLFRKDAILFERAFAHVPLTLPSHANILTGRLPADTGIRDNVGYTLGSGIPTLPELLKKEGYATGAVVSSYVMRKESGIARGFDDYEDHFETGDSSEMVAMSSLQRDGAEAVRIASDWLRRHREGRSFYMLHLYDPHTPYAPPEPFATRYRHEPYDGEVAWVDQVLGDFVSFLRQEGLYDRATIILLSDHGEGLGEHGEDEHGIFVYRWAIQVPLIVKLPHSERRGTTVSAPAQLVDVFPTVARLAGLHLESEPAGRSLLDLRDGDTRDVLSESYYGRLHFGWSELHSLTDGRYQYIHAPRPELYDLGSDPAQRHDLREEQRRVAAAMRDRLEPHIRQAPAPATVDPEQARKLAALGYLGTAVSVDPGGALPDPKDEIESFRDLRKAFEHFMAGRHAAALRLTDELVAENPRMADAWGLRARSLDALERPEDALESAKRALRLAPGAMQIVQLVAEIALRLGRLDEAASHAELLLQYDPLKANEILGNVALRRGDFEEAAARFREALQAAESHPMAAIALGALELDQQRPEQALVYFDRARDLLDKAGKPAVQNLHFYRGDALARLGRTAEAVAAFEEEIRLFRRPEPYRNLILLHLAEGRNEEATRVLRRLIDEVPTAAGYLVAIDVLRAVGDEEGVRFWTAEARRRFPEDEEIRNIAALNRDRGRS